jgi:tetratricopeptide (TPR) repeat protein
VLSFGGPPTFEPSAWEWAFRAAALTRTDPARAKEILADGLEAWPASAALHYNLACLEAVAGPRDAALAALRKALELKPEAAEWARDDVDFTSLRDDPEFRALVAP